MNKPLQHLRPAGLLLFVALIVSSCDSRQEKVLTLHENWQFRKTGDTVWYPAEIPGVVQLDLLNNGLIEDPFYRDNEKELQYIEQEDWVYETNFDVPEDLFSRQQLELVFKGLDTYADVFLNGELILKANNMFRSWNIPVRKHLKPTDNHLKVVFRSPVNEVLPMYNALPYQYPAGNDQSEQKVSIFTRKAPYHYGWDWGPRFVTSGIWKEVVLKGWDRIKISGFQVYQQKVTDEKASLKVVLELASSVSGKAEVGISIDNEVVEAFAMNLKTGMNRKEVMIGIEEPELWWTNGLGEQHLYRIGAVAAIDKEEVKTAVNYGIRTLELVQEPDDEGEGRSFYFKLNGVPVFMKGANYIPQDSFLPRVSEQQYRDLLSEAKNAHMNMIRVWGGGIYEKDLFYDLCDEMGILVWQDFMFACSMYPGDEAFLFNVRKEAEEQVQRLRNHPSLALWCGNNEIATAWHHWGWQDRFSEQQQERLWNDYQRIFHELLPEVTGRYDPGRPYWPSSPNFEERMRGKEHLSGDMHYWEVWHGRKPFEEFDDHVGRFMSEYGFQSFPEYETVKSYTLPEDRNIESRVMLHHQRHPIGNQLIRTYMERDYKIPEDFEDFLYVSQLLQARGIGRAIRAHRIHMPYCMGTLYWQLNDCWPVASWSGIDYYGRKKALHYTVQKEYQPVMLDIVPFEQYFDVYIVNDHHDKKNIYLKITLHDFMGADSVMIDDRLTIDANASEMYHTCEPGAVFAGTNLHRSVIHLEVIERETEEVLADRLYYFVKPKELNLPEHTGLKGEVNKTRSGYEITLTTENLAKNVFISIPDVPGAYSDNYFDMLPGSSRTVLFSPENPEAVITSGKLKTKTLNDIY